jgi:hypothetical protein
MRRTQMFVALAACVLMCVGAAAQSGRRRTPQQSPTPQASPETSSEGESESESRPRAADAKGSAVVSFIVFEDDAQVSFGADNMMRQDVVESFMARLRRSSSVSVTGGERGSRSEARKRAQGETAAFVVLVALEDEYGPVGPSPRGSDQERNRTLVIRTTVFEPKTGAIKYTDTTYQRRVRQTVGIGGIGIPVPTRTIGRYPAQLELRQAAHDAADRVLARFQVVLPPDQP